MLLLLIKPIGALALRSFVSIIETSKHLGTRRCHSPSTLRRLIHLHHHYRFVSLQIRNNDSVLSNTEQTPSGAVAYVHFESRGCLRWDSNARRNRRPTPAVLASRRKQTMRHKHRFLVARWLATVTASPVSALPANAQSRRLRLGHQHRSRIRRHTNRPDQCRWDIRSEFICWVGRYFDRSDKSWLTRVQKSARAAGRAASRQGLPIRHCPGSEAPPPRRRPRSRSARLRNARSCQPRACG